MDWITICITGKRLADSGVFFGGGGGGGGEKSTHQTFIRGGSAPRSSPLPFYIRFLTETIALSYTFH